MRKIGGVILAAGGSTRLGEPKQLLEFAGETLVHAAVRAAQGGGCDVVCVVTGRAAKEVENAVAGLGTLIAKNEDWERGLGSSIRVGVNAIQPVAAIVLLACDQPAVDGETVRSLIERHEQTGRSIVASSYAGTLGIPALFDRSCFAELLSLPDDRGAKAVIQKDLERVAHFVFSDGALDLDSPEDVHAWRMKIRSSRREAN